MFKINTKNSALKSLVLAGFVGVCSTGVSQGIVTVIDFEILADEENLVNQYAAQGVTFVDASAESSLPLTGQSGLTFIIHTSSDFQPTESDPIEAIFTSSDVTSVSITGLDVGANGFILKAFDSVSGGTELDSSQFVGPDIGFGAFTTLTVNSSGIRRVEFSQFLTGSSRDGLAFDDLTFTTVPEPSSTLLLSAGLGLLTFHRKRR